MVTMFHGCAGENADVILLESLEQEFSSCLVVIQSNPVTHFDHRYRATQIVSGFHFM